MKGKKAVYVMLPLVLGIWVMIIYKVYKTVNGNKENPVLQTQDTFKPSTKLISDTFAIIAAYRDPFLGKIFNDQPANKNDNTNNSSFKNVPPLVKTVMPWPSVNYVGIIKNKKSSKQTILVQLNGREMIMKEGEKAEGLMLCKVYKDSIEFSREKEKHYYKK